MKAGLPGTAEPALVYFWGRAPLFPCISDQPLSQDSQRSGSSELADPQGQLSLAVTLSPDRESLSSALRKMGPWWQRNPPRRCLAFDPDIMCTKHFLHAGHYKHTRSSVLFKIADCSLSLFLYVQSTHKFHSSCNRNTSALKQCIILRKFLIL